MLEDSQFNCVLFQKNEYARGSHKTGDPLLTAINTSYSEVSLSYIQVYTNFDVFTNFITMCCINSFLI